MTAKSAQKPPLTKLHEWFTSLRTDDEKNYLHILLKELSNIPDVVWEELLVYIDHAHEGARSSLRTPLGESLNPIMHGTKNDPAYGYPHKLNIITLQGFFGEILTGIIAENYEMFGSAAWEVPVYLFRTHITAFQQLEEIKQTNEWQKMILGRTGDDGLAFERDGGGNINRWMACEAKCTSSHNSGLINDNHEKLAHSSAIKPIDLLRTIEALQDYVDDKFSQDWIESLRKMYFEKKKIDRCDLSVYVYGKRPVQKKTWIPTNKPHKNYTAKRKLTATEVHITDLVAKIQNLYNRMDQES